MGGSNGGLLMGVELTQHPELWHAVDIQVPLLDMLRYETDRCRRVVGGGIRQCLESRRADVSGVDFAVPESQARGGVSRATDLDHDQGRPGGATARAQVRGEDGVVRRAVPVLRSHRGRTRRGRQSARAGAHLGAGIHLLHPAVDAVRRRRRSTRCAGASSPR